MLTKVRIKVPKVLWTDRRVYRPGHKWVLNEATAVATKPGSDLIKKQGNGKVYIRIIEPGQGATGFYTPEVLMVAAKSGVFDNAPVMRNHPKTGQRTERPDIDLTVGFVDPGTAKYEENGEEGPGVYATMTVLEPERRKVYSLVGTPFGMSIHADGQLERFGDTTSNVTSIDKVHSVDLVVKPGAGGAIIKVLESEKLKAATKDSYPLEPWYVAQQKESIMLKLDYGQLVEDEQGNRYQYLGNLKEDEPEEEEIEEGTRQKYRDWSDKNPGKAQAAGMVGAGPAGYASVKYGQEKRAKARATESVDEDIYEDEDGIKWQKVQEAGVAGLAAKVVGAGKRAGTKAVGLGSKTRDYTKRNPLSSHVGAAAGIGAATGIAAGRMSKSSKQKEEAGMGQFDGYEIVEDENGNRYAFLGNVSEAVNEEEDEIVEDENGVQYRRIVNEEKVQEMGGMRKAKRMEAKKDDEKDDDEMTEGEAVMAELKALREELTAMKNAPAKEEAIAESIREVLPGQSDQVYSLIESASANFEDVKQAQAFAIMTGRILEASTGQPVQTNGQHNGWFDKNEQPTARATAPAVVKQEEEAPKSRRWWLLGLRWGQHKPTRVCQRCGRTYRLDQRV